MANNENLIPFNKQTESEQRENARKGGKKSGEVRRKRKAMKEQLKLLLSLPLKDENTRQKIIDLGVEDEEINNQMAINIAIIKEALSGNISAYTTIRDTIDEKPKEKIEHSGTISYENLINEIKGDTK